ncbi:MAG TPA: hypothetical protein ENI96_13400 [Sedimenticola thiotaurini]|uniref:Sulfotransferase family protein n=1 Tax=Sedimenticola thiotaurini TaxID=1543721 RepID=A0A831RNL8_9GAMM|nr:hypothetical protein [Sedimenticola thiotaurini]
MEPILFVHVPKTAGTSFRKGIDRCFGRDASSRDYGRESVETSPEVLKFMYDEVDHWAFMQAFRAAERRFLVGHYPLNRYVGLFGAVRSIAFVRDPVQRVVSEYHHSVANKGYRGSLGHFYLERRHVNTQSRLLGGVPLDAIGVVGITERYADSLRLIESGLGIRIPLLERNRARADLAQDHDLAPSLQEEIRIVNAADQELYRRAGVIFSRRLEALERGEPYVRGEISEVRNGRLIGWAVREGDEAPVSLEVSVAGETLGTTVAREYRWLLKALGLGRGGYIGFSIPLPEGTGGKRVTCRVAGSGQPLSNSPWPLPEWEGGGVHGPQR